MGALTDGWMPARFFPYSRMFAEMLEGVLVATPDGRVVMANDAAARIFEVALDDLLIPLADYAGRFALREPGGAPSVPVATRALGGEIVAPVERRIGTPSGEKIIRTSAAPLRDEQGNITGAVVLAVDISAHKAEEERAREHAAQLQRAHDDLARALVDAERAAELLEHGDGLIELDRSWGIVRVNAAQERTTGKPRGETLGRSFWDVWPEAADPRGSPWLEYHRCMEERVPVQFESHYAPFDTWYGITAYPTRGGGIAVSFRDITKRKRAEEAAREGDRRLRAFFQSVMELAGVHEAVRDASGGVVDSIVREVNEPALHFIGRRREEVVGRRLSEVLPPQLVRALTAPWTEVLATAIPARYEVEYSGHVLAVSASRMAADTIAAVADDITERKRREIDQSLLVAVAHDFARFSSEDEITEAVGARLATHLDVPTCTVAAFVDGVATVRSAPGRSGALEPASTLEVTQIVSDALRRGAPDGHSIVVRDTREDRRVDATRWEALGVRAAVIVPCHVGGEWQHSLLVGTPFPRDWRDDEVQLLEELASRFFSRIERARAEEALARANARLVETDRRRTEFLGVLSHELRNPLAPILNSIEILEAVPQGPQAARARQVIMRQTRHLARLVDDLLDTTRISQGKIRLHREVVDLRTLVWRTCEDHRSMFAEAGIDMDLDLPEGPVWGDVDATRIAQVIGNLLHNANKFTQPGGAVTVHLRRRAGHAEVAIRDNGAGIGRGEIARMFEPFAQEDRSLARTRGGLGLGLALSKGLIELHGGTITASSDGPGTGSEFVFSVPLVERAAPPAPEAGATSREQPRRRILVIEDNPDAARTLAEVLELGGHEVTTARNGTVGIALAHQLRPDVVICDLGLPDLDGFEVGRALRADDALRSATLIALSGYAQPEDIERAREAGFDAHLAKPAPLEQLDSLLGADQGAG